MLGGASSHNWF